MADSQSAGSCTQAHCRQRNTRSGRDIFVKKRARFKVGSLSTWEVMVTSCDRFLNPKWHAV